MDQFLKQKHLWNQCEPLRCLTIHWDRPLSKYQTWQYGGWGGERAAVKWWRAASHAALSAALPDGTRTTSPCLLGKAMPHQWVRGMDDTLTLNLQVRSGFEGAVKELNVAYAVIEIVIVAYILLKQLCLYFARFHSMTNMDYCTSIFFKLVTLVELQKQKGDIFQDTVHIQTFYLYSSADIFSIHHIKLLHLIQLHKHSKLVFIMK